MSSWSALTDSRPTTTGSDQWVNHDTAGDAVPALSVESQDQAVGEAGTGRPVGYRVAAAVGLVIALVAAAVGVFALRGPSSEELAVAAAQSEVVDLLDQLAEAETTADLQAIAVAAQPAVADLEAALDVAPEDSGTRPLMTAYQSLLAGLVTLSEVDRDHLGRWDAVSGSLLEAADAVQSQVAQDEEQPDVSALAQDSVASASRMVGQAQQVMADWRAERDAVNARNQANQELRSELDAYVPQVESILSQYGDERHNTRLFMDRVRGSGATVSEAYDAFRDGENARRDLAARLRTLNYPDGLASEHDRLVSMVEAGAAAMAAGYQGIEEYVYDYGYTPYDNTPGHIRFQEESDRISSEFGAAESTWSSAVSAAYDAAQDEQLPKKPIV